MKKLLLCLTITLGLASASAHAGPTGRLGGGNTGVALSDDFTGALASLGVDLDLLSPMRIADGLVRFRIPTGALDLDTLAGDIFHRGGITLSAGGTTVDLINVIIDTTTVPTLTGIVVVNGDVVGRVTLFDLGLTGAPTITEGVLVQLPGVELNFE